MVLITEDLIRKRAEHNEKEIFSLEEVSLHQQDIEKIEYIDKWCRELKILYLQSNLIPKIENLKKLKKLEYLNLALNNVERIENLEGCESLKKLDLTVNFVGELTSVDELKSLEFLEELYLTGNPCTEFEGYRDYVIATLPQLQKLDGIEITKSERILAIQNYKFIKQTILNEQEKWFSNRIKDKEDSEIRKRMREEKFSKTTNATEFDEVNKEFWDEKVPFTPESRIEVHQHMQNVRKKDDPSLEETPKHERRLFRNDGTPYHVNEAKISIDEIKWSGVEDDSRPYLTVDIPIFRYLDSSLLNCDVQPNYLRLTIKGKILQLVLPEEVRPDSSTAERSKTTGHMLITMPKVRDVVQFQPVVKKEDTRPQVLNSDNVANSKNGHKYLEVDDTGLIQLNNIVKSRGNEGTSKHVILDDKLFRPRASQCPLEKLVSENFVDDPDVPPLL